MNQEIRIKFNSLPSDGNTLSFDKYQLYPSNLTVNTITLTFKTSRSAPGQVTIGANITAIITNFITAFNTDYNSAGSYVIYTESGDLIIKGSQTLGPIFNPVISGGSFASFEYPVGEIRARSPYLYINPNPVGATGNIYNLFTGLTASIFTYQDNTSGEWVNQEIGPSSTGLSNCAVPSTITATNGGTSSIGGTCTESLDFDTAQYELRIFTGNINSDIPVSPTYSKTKQKVGVSAQNKIYINLSSLVRDNLEGDIDNYLEEDSYSTSRDLGPTESKWISADCTLLKLGATASYSDSSFFVTDGYCEGSETQELPNILLNNNGSTLSSYRKQLSSNSQERIHFKTKDLSNILWTNSVGATGTISVTADEAQSSQYVKSIRVDSTSDSIRYEFVYGASTYTVDYTFYNDCKFTPQNIIFKNKFGVLETVSFPKKSTKTITTESSEYQRSIVDYNGDFNPNRHTKKNYNLTGKEEVTLNTDWVSEWMNPIFKDLMLSEECWLFDGTSIIPINKSTTSFNYKTSVNDKLIQYQMKFTYSHEAIQNFI